MAFTTASVIEVRTTGNDLNGGGFNPASSGVDYSQQDAAQASGTASSSGATVTATTGIFTSQMVGNFITNGTTWCEITAFTSSTIVTVDAAPTWTAQSVKVGGALATLTKGVPLLTSSGMQLWIKSGTYVMTAGLTVPTTPGFTAFTQIQGYGTARGDAGTKPVIQVSGSAVTLLTTNQAGTIFRWLDFDGNSQTTSRGIQVADQLGSRILNCKFRNFTNSAINATAYGWVFGCEFTTNSSQVVVSKAAVVEWCYFHDNTVTCYTNPDANGMFQNNIVANNTGATTDGVITTYDCTIVNNTFYNNGRHGVNVASFTGADGPILNNLYVKNGGYGINAPANASSGLANPMWNYNGFGAGTMANTSGQRNNGTAGANDVTLTANVDPFTNAAGGDFSLNNTTGGGALLRGVAFQSYS